MTAMLERAPERPALDLLDPDIFAAGHPHAPYDRIRAETPVYRHPGSAVQPGFWALLRHRDIETVSRDPARFTSTRGFRLTSDMRAGMWPSVTSVLARTLIATDPPEQMHQRGPAQPFFMPAGLRRVEERLHAYIADLFEGVERELEDTGGAPIEFVERIAAVIPIKMISLLLGMPESDEHRIFDWTNRVLGSDDPEYARDIGDASSAYEEMFEYSLWLMEERRREPRDDVMTALAHATVDGAPMDEDIRKGFAATLIAAGNDTTRNSLSGAMLTLAAHPHERAQLAANPAMMGKAVDELLRYISPVVQFMRTATQDTEVGGQPIAAGERIVMLYGAGNRDPEMFDDPHRLILDRANANRHLTFGIGAHRCLGSRLAGTQLSLMLGEILRRYPEYRVLGEPSLMRSNFLWGVKALNVALR